MSELSFGRFRLLELLGRGGMAEVWKAKLDGTGGFSRTVVVKRILPHLAADPQFTRMFEREARLSSQLTHANIVQVFEFGESSGEPYLAMEYVAGFDLTRVISTLGALPVGLGPYVAREVARALSYAHTLTSEGGEPLHLVHRDISPSNVLLGLDGSVKLLDFGIAKALAETSAHTQTGTFKGKVGYSSPEAADGHDIDARADLFALGVVLYESLIGERLFRGESDIQTLGKVREANVEPPSRRRPGIPAALDAVVLRALARRREERFQTAAELADALDPLVHQLGFGPSQLAALLKTMPTSGATAPPVRDDTALAQTTPARRWPLVVGVLAALLGVSVLGLSRLFADAPTHEPPPQAPVTVAAAPPEPPPTPEPIPEPPPQPAPDVPPPASPRAMTVDVWLNEGELKSLSTPSGARLAVKHRAGKSDRVTVSAAGYESRVVEVSAAQKVRVTLPLVKPPKKRKAADVKGGAVVDPFDR